jgi:hypothetical protein
MIMNDNGNNDETDQEQMRFFAHLVYQLQMTSSKSNIDKNTFIFTVHEEEEVHIHIHTYIHIHIHTYIYVCISNVCNNTYTIFLVVHRPSSILMVIKLSPVPSVMSK